MESNNNNDGLISFYHTQLHQQNPSPPSAATVTPRNGVVVPNSTTANSGGMLYPHSVPSSAVSSSLESVKRKRGRPRKYGTPEQAAAAKRLSASSGAGAAASQRKRDAASSGGGGVASGSSSYSSKKSQLAAFGNVGQSFSPRIITVANGEDVGQKVMMFIQQSKREMCILSATGSVSNASLRQPATSGGSVTYEGRFDILSLSGSYIRAEDGGRTGGLSVCLASSDGQIIGGGVVGPLLASGPIQVIVGTFLIDSKKDIKVDSANVSGKLSSPPIGGGVSSLSGLSFRSPVESPHQIGSGNQFMIPHRNMQQQLTPQHSMEWRGSTLMHQSPENGDYEHIQD